MKQIAVLMVAVVAVTGVEAQGVFSNRTNGALEKVIHDYPNQFRNIKGDLLESRGESFEYKSTVSVPGGGPATVTLYKVPGNTNVSWTATLYTHENFQEASKRYRELYNQIRNTIVKLEGEKPVILNGKYISPVASRRLNSVLFDIVPASEATRKIKVELMLAGSGNQWKVLLTVYDRNIDEEASVVSNIDN